MLEKIGMGEFRDHLAKYLSSTTPIAVTCQRLSAMTKRIVLDANILIRAVLGLISDRLDRAC